MIIGIHPDRSGNESYSEKWAEFIAARGVEARTINLLASDGLQQAQACDGVMWRWKHTPGEKQAARRIFYMLEHVLKVPVFPSLRSAWHFDDKIAQSFLFKALQAPTPDTWVFWDEASAVEWARSASYPVIFKLSAGAGSANVQKVEDEQQASHLIHRSFRRGIFSMTMNEYNQQRKSPLWRRARQLVRRMGDAFRYLWLAEYPALPGKWWQPEHGSVYFQEFLPGNNFDTRITVIGERLFGFRRLNRPVDFRASGSGLLEFDPAGIDPRCLQIAFEISQKSGFECMAYDFLYRQNEPVINEMSYAFADWAVQSCPGHWKPDLSWQAGQMWPEEAQVEVFLQSLLARQVSG